MLGAASSGRPLTKMKKRFLLVLDFDNTLITHKPDVTISVQTLFEDRKLPGDLQIILKDYGWGDRFIHETFRQLSSGGVTRKNIEECLKTEPLLEGMKELCLWAASAGGEIIVVSDSHTTAVEMVVEANELPVAAVFANHSQFNREGELVFTHADPSHRCLLSRRNVCKGNVLDSYLDKHCAADVDDDFFVAFAGDGNNDVCAALRLRPDRDDWVFPRKNFHLAQILANAKSGGSYGVAIAEWSTGHDIKTALEERLERSE